MKKTTKTTKSPVKPNTKMPPAKMPAMPFKKGGKVKGC